MEEKRVPVDDLERVVAELEVAHRIVSVDRATGMVRFEPRAERVTPGDVETRA